MAARMRSGGICNKMATANQTGNTIIPEKRVPPTWKTGYYFRI